MGKQQVEWVLQFGGVRGHMCEGLREHFESGGGCKPVLSPDGIIQGCDDENPVRITHCPYCGERLSG